MNIGKTVTITSTRNPQLNGKSGTIDNETKHTITLNTHKGTKTLIKQHITIEETQ